MSEKVWRFTLFQFGKLPGKLCFSSLCLALHGKLCFSSGHRDGRGTETGCVSETASLQFTSLASRKQWGLSGQRDSKALANQTSLGSGPCLAQFDGHTRPISLFLTFFFAFRHLKFHFGGPETGSEEKYIKRHHQQQTNRFELDPEVARTHLF